MNEYLQHRTNINTSNYKGKKIIIYEDHRYILNVLKHTLDYTEIKLPINLIYFDFHDDAYINNSILTPERINEVNAYDFEKFYNSVEFIHSIEDDDWLISAFEYGFLSNALNICGQDLSSLLELNGTYTDCSNIVHNINSISKSDIENNICDFKLIKKFIERKFILDFDLDFMTKDNGAGHFEPMSEQELDRLFNKEITKTKTLKTLINDLVEESELITICKESKYCGGFEKSDMFLQYLNKMFFNGNLNKLN